MSTKNIDALVRDAQVDPDLADRVRRAGGLAELVRIGAERGYDFTQDELEAYLESPPPAELSEQELEAVAAGSNSAHVAISLGNGTMLTQDAKYKSAPTDADAVGAGDTLLHRWQR